MAPSKQVSFRIKETAISLMKKHEYKGAWHILEEATRKYPGLPYLYQMSFVCNILQIVDPIKPGYGVDWRQILQLSPEADVETIRIRFQELINSLEAIKNEFPGTEIAQGFLLNAMQNLCDQDKNENTSLASSICDIDDANNGTITEDDTISWSLKRKKYSGNGSSNLNEKGLSRNYQAARKCEAPRNVGNFPRKLVFGWKCQDNNDSKLPENSNKVKASGEGQKDFQELEKDTESGKACKRVNETLVTMEIDKKKDNGDINHDSHLVEAKEDRIRRISSIFDKDHSLSPEVKALKCCLFKTMPQSPHYSSLANFHDEIRHWMIKGIEIAFVKTAEEIHNLVSVQDIKCNRSAIVNQLLELERMGYNVEKLRIRMEDLCRSAERGQDAWDKFQAEEVESRDWETQIKDFEAKNSTISSWISKTESELKRAKEKLVINDSVINFQKTKKREVDMRKDQHKGVRRANKEIAYKAKLPW